MPWKCKQTLLRSRGADGGARRNSIAAAAIVVLTAILGNWLVAGDPNQTQSIAAFAAADAVGAVNTSTSEAKTVDEDSRSKPTIRNNLFLIGLSNVEADRLRNVLLLKNNSRMDIAIVYENQRRAILALEKGHAGAHVFDKAFATWGQ